MATCFVVVNSSGEDVSILAVACTAEIAEAELLRQAELLVEAAKTARIFYQVKVRGSRAISIKGVAELYIEEVPLIS